MRRAIRSDDGFTIIELSVVAGLLLIFMIPVYRFIDSITQSEHDTAVLAHQATNTRETMDGLVRELRQANSGSGAAPIQALSPTFRFLSPDRSTPYRARRLEYQVVGSGTSLRLERRVTVATNTAAPWNFPPTAPPWETVVERLASGSTISNVFTFRNAGGATTTNLSQIKTIEINVRFDPVSAPRAPNVQNYKTTVEVRNKTS